MAISENGWPTLEADSRLLYTWNIRCKGGMVQIRMHNGSVGLCLAYAVLLWDKWIEPVWGKVKDDWGHAVRPVRGGIAPSNHYSATAVDINAMKHPLGKVGTVLKAALWRALMLRRFGTLLRWGGDYHHRKDEMHVELRPGTHMEDAERRAFIILRSKLGKQLIRDNPTQLRVINS